jgi:hypothetical protein
MVSSQDGVMKARSLAWLAWFTGGLVLALFLATMAFVALRPPQIPRGIESLDALGLLLDSGPFLVFAALGVLIAASRPQNRIGWMFAAIGFLLLFVGFAAEYALYGLYTNPGALPAGAFMAWASIWPWLIGAGLIVLLVLLLPDGRLASRRWRPLAWFVVADTAIMALSAAVLLWSFQGLQLLGDLESKTLSPVAEQIIVIGFPLLLVMLLPATASMVLRFHRARGDERQQLKWVAYGAGVLVMSQVFTVGSDVTGVRLSSTSSQLIDTIGLVAVPVVVSIAILRHRLYDIDLIIHRTLVYGGLTALLALVYLGGVVGVGGLVRGLTGQERNNLVVAASTLAVAGLFRPARSRIQRFIDRRFYRSKYDAQQTLADFSAKMRDEIDLDSLTSEMTAVVRDTVQPTHVSLWLRS